QRAAPAPMGVRRAAAGAAAAAPLSFSQERLWFLDRFEPGSLLNLPAAVRFTGALDVPALGGAIGEIPPRHQVLRPAFAQLGDGRPAQRVLPWRPRGLPAVD